MLRSLIAYDANGEVVATLEYCIAKDENGDVVGLVDFEAIENSGGRLRDVWENSAAVGSVTWPEWLGGAAYNYTVELDPSPGPARAKIKALVHKQSGHKRERAAIEAEIASRIEAAQGEPADLRDLLGGPGRPLRLDAEGRTRPKVARSPSRLPVVRRERASPSGDGQGAEGEITATPVPEAERVKPGGGK